MASALAPVTVALRVQGSDCSACGFSSGAVHGPLGAGFAEVHHLASLGSLQADVLVDPLGDVVVLCANCHRMVHREDPPVAPDELQIILRRRHN